MALLASGAVVACDVPAPSSPVPFPLLTGKAGPVTARVSVSQFRDLGADVEAAAYAAAKDIKAGAALLNGGNIGVHGVYRKGVAVRLAPSTAQYPESAAAVDARSAAELYGPVVGGALAHGNAVLSKTSASLFGARAGDVLAVWTWTNRRLAYIGVDAVVDDAQVPAELTMSTVTAGRIGFHRPTSVQLYGYKSDAAIDAALKAHGLPRVDARVSRGGGGPTPDSTLDLATTKAELGQFWYISNADGTVTVDPVWRQANVVHTSFAGIPISAWCHKTVVPAIQSALNEIAASGLAGAIDVGNTNRYGGCFGPREVRASGGTTGGNLSRHTWAMALDMNTATNPMGGVPDHGLPRRADLPQVGLRLGRQLHDPRWHALRVGGPGSQPDQLPLSLLPEHHHPEASRRRRGRGAGFWRFASATADGPDLHAGGDPGRRVSLSARRH